MRRAAADLVAERYMLEEDIELSVTFAARVVGLAGRPPVTRAILEGMPFLSPSPRVAEPTV